MKPAKLFYAALVAMAAFAFWFGSANAQRLLSPDEAKPVAIMDLQANASEISGRVVNNSPHIIREIEVLIQYHWLWANEYKPGNESPGRVASVRLHEDILPGQSASFKYVPAPPLPNRQDGRFDPEVVIAGFSVVSPATTTSR